MFYCIRVEAESLENLSAKYCPLVPSLMSTIAASFSPDGRKLASLPEVGAHLSPCARCLAACVACVLPNVEADPGFVSQLNHDVGQAGTSPTRHPTSACQVMYELCINSFEKSTYGSVLVSRAVRAAHCLTSVLFLPTSEHILLAYGWRHSSFLKSIIINGEVPFLWYTVLEVSDLELVNVLPNAEDEVNVACFHPSAGGGLVYGSKVCI